LARSSVYPALILPEKLLSWKLCWSFFNWTTSQVLCSTTVNILQQFNVTGRPKPEVVPVPERSLGNW